MHQSLNPKILFLIPLLAVAACGGSGGGGDGGTDPFIPPDPVFADDQPVTRDSFSGQTFPISLIVQSPDGGPPLSRVTGSVEYIDADTIMVTYNGVSTEYTFRSAFGNENWTSGNLDNDAGAFSDLIMNRPTDIGRIGRFQLVSSIGAPPGFSGYDYGVFGFATPADKLTGSAIYNDMSFTGTQMLIAVDGQNNVIRAPSDSMNLNVQFSDNMVSGTVFEGGYTIGVGASSSSHDVVVGVENGFLSGSGFTGDLTVEMTTNGMASTTTTTNTGIDGFFFGNNAEMVAGTYQADFEEQLAGGGSRGGTLVGVFSAEQD